MDIKEFLDLSSTPYQAIQNSIEILKENGFSEIKENEKFSVKKGGKYYIVRDGSALIAFRVGSTENYSYKIIASHTDSPMLKIKYGGENVSQNLIKLDTEVYGGTILYSWFDRPLRLAGRITVKNENGSIEVLPVRENTTIVIPSVAIHLNRQINSGFAPNAQTDMQPICALGADKKYMENLFQKYLLNGQKVIDCDLFVTSGESGFYSGLNGELFSSPRIDNLASVYSSIKALLSSGDKGINVVCLYDNEEVGSRTKQGAGGQFLAHTLGRINTALGKSQEDFYIAMQNSFMVSCDGAHGAHPNHPELSSPNNKVYLGGGIVIKHHANQNYTTDSVSSSIIKTIFDRSGVKYQDFYSKSDVTCGGTLGAISSSQYSVRSVDIGIAQLAMHSSVETVAKEDIKTLEDGLSAFFKSNIRSLSYDKIEIGE